MATTRRFEHTIDYGFIADLCAACGWALALKRSDEEADVWYLRVYEERPIISASCLAGVKFTGQANLDAVAEIIFERLREKGHV